jgi:[protein-PII] uridylyltransferase
MRDDPEASRLFLDVLCSRKDPATTLGRMSEAGLLGRLLPDFGRVVGQTQHNLYHVYTVDEHTIRAVDTLHRIERGELAGELPLASEVLPKILSRRELYLAIFLHDLGKGRGGDHSVVGEAIAQRLCRRLGLPDDATETVAWLVRHHLVMSNVAFRRDLEDPKTIADFVAVVQSPERLKLLLVLTVCDIRAVGPGVWNGWKGQLLRELYHETASAMAADDPQGRRAARIEEARRRLADALTGLPGGAAWPAEAAEAYVGRHDPRYWLGFGTDEQVRHAEVVRAADAARAPLAVDFRVDEFRARTEMLLYAADHPGLFMKVAGALALSGVSIVDAHIFTTNDGMALDVLGFQDAANRTAVAEAARFARIRGNIERALGGEIWFEKDLAGRRSLPARADVFQVEPRVLVDNTASRTHSVIEVNGRDRPGLLFEVAKALKDLGLVIHSAHVSTYGERVVDVFYVKDVFGLKLTQRSKLQRVHRRLFEALADPLSPRYARDRAPRRPHGGARSPCSRGSRVRARRDDRRRLGAGPRPTPSSSASSSRTASGACSRRARSAPASSRSSPAPPPRTGRMRRGAWRGAPPASCWAWCCRWCCWPSWRCPGWCACSPPASSPGASATGSRWSSAGSPSPTSPASRWRRWPARSSTPAGRFAAAAATPVLLNLTLIAALALAAALGFEAVWALAWGVAARACSSSPGSWSPPRGWGSPSCPGRCGAPTRGCGGSWRSPCPAWAAPGWVR